MLNSGCVKFMGHTFLIIATFYFFMEMTDPYDTEEHVKVADMAWIISVCVFYLDKWVMSKYQTRIERIEGGIKCVSY